MVYEAKNPSSLRIKLDLGMENGRTKVRSKTFSALKHNASAQNVYDVANALMGLQEYTPIEIAKIDNTTLA